MFSRDHHATTADCARSGTAVPDTRLLTQQNEHKMKFEPWSRTWAGEGGSQLSGGTNRVGGTATCPKPPETNTALRCLDLRLTSVVLGCNPALTPHHQPRLFGANLMIRCESRRKFRKHMNHDSIISLHVYFSMVLTIDHHEIIHYVIFRDDSMMKAAARYQYFIESSNLHCAPATPRQGSSRALTAL